MESKNNQVQEILTGSIDFNAQAYPDISDLRMDPMETGRYAYESQMAGFVLKSSQYLTTPIAYILNQMYPGLSVAGSITLSESVGGINPTVVESAAALKTKVIWIPESKEKKLTPNNSLTESIQEILKIVREKNMVLALDNLSYSESIVILKEAKKNHISNIIIGFNDVIPQNNDLKDLSDLGAFIEFRFSSCMPSDRSIEIEEIIEKIGFIGSERCIVTSNFGQWFNPPPAEGIRMAISSFLQKGLTEDQITKLVKSNPLDLLK